MQNSTFICLIFIFVLFTKTQSYLFDKVLTLSPMTIEENRNDVIQDQLNTPLSNKLNNYKASKNFNYGVNNNQVKHPYPFLYESSDTIDPLNTALPLDTIYIPTTYNKNKNGYIKKSLKKFHSSQSRNCFFSPINCMIQHDVNKFRKMIDLSP
uniref:MAM domain-containing protein n=1 Tax=Strongyloides stercoralis TaxID=6248 RepID=A0A0K0EGM0_STRER